MKTVELKLCRSLAQDLKLDLSEYDDAPLFGFGLPDFKPVEVHPYVVAKCIRWQCQRLDGSFDEKQWNEDRRFYLKNVELATISPQEIAGLAAKYMFQ